MKWKYYGNMRRIVIKFNIALVGISVNVKIEVYKAKFNS